MCAIKLMLLPIGILKNCYTNPRRVKKEIAKPKSPKVFIVVNTLEFNCNEIFQLYKLRNLSKL